MSTGSTGTEIESTIRILEDDRYAAVVRGDVDAFAALAHPALTYTHSDGAVDSLDSYRKKIESGYYVYHRISHPIDEIVVSGDTALVVGEMDADITAGGTRKTLRNRALAVWVRPDDRWLLIAYQPTVLPAPAGDGEQAVTDEVVTSFDATPDPRLREVLQSLVRHLHAFARDVRLTEQEWEAAIAFLTRVGHISDSRRQEFILLSDVLGLSMLTVAINGAAAPGATEATVFGPFFVDDAPEVPLGGDIARGAAGTPCYVSGSVRSTDGTPLAGARLDVWEADENGVYDVQYSSAHSAGRGWLRTGTDGGYRFWSVLPTAYPIPHDGPVGALLDAAGRGHMRPAHLHVKVTAAGSRTLVTHIFVAGDPHLADDAVFGVKESLVVQVVEHDGGVAPDGSHRGGRWASIEFDLVLSPQA